MSPRACLRWTSVVVLCAASAACLEKPGPPAKVDVSKMTPREKAAVVEKALAAATVDPEAVQPAEIDAQAELAEMKGVLRPSGDEVIDLERAFANRKREIEAWMQSEKYARLVTLEAELSKVAAANDAEAIARVKGEVQPLRDELKTLVERHRLRILDALTEDNRLKWLAHRLTERMRQLMQPLGLSTDQVTELRALAWTAIERNAATHEPPALQHEAFLQLESEMEKNVLRAGQRRSYETVKKENPLRATY